MEMGKVKDIMTKDPVCCSPETSLEKVAKSMCDSDCGEIPVLDDEEKPIGVITDRDITCRTVAEAKNPLDLKAEDCMTRECITIDEEASLEECCELMEKHQIRRVPVVDDEGRCCGIVAQADIALNAPREKIAEVLQEVSKAA